MSPGLQRFAGALGAVAISAIVNLATGLLTDHTAVKWWISGAVLLVVGVLIQWWLPMTQPQAPSRRQSVADTTVGGSVNQKMHGAGAQTVANARITEDLTQDQNK
jgi:hypothetical protein